MIYNDQISVEYGQFNIQVQNLTPPPIFKPVPLSAYYTRGIISRTFILKLNGNSGQEIDPKLISQVNLNLYKPYTFNWRIAGSRYLSKTGNIINDYGVEAQNKQELQRVGSPDGVDLTKFFQNFLEYWRGY